MKNKFKINLSAIILTQNNENTISKIIGQLEKFVDEIIIVDGGSIDSTLKTAKLNNKTKIYHNSFNGNFAEQRNFGINRAKGKWILSIDTDELLSTNASKWIPFLIKLPVINWFTFPRVWLVERNSRIEYISNKPYFPDRQLRLFRNSKQFRYKINGHNTHETFPKKSRGLGINLSFIQIIHFNFIINDRQARKKKVNKYIKLDPSKINIHKRYLWENRDVKFKEFSHHLLIDLRNK